MPCGTSPTNVNSTQPHRAPSSSEAPSVRMQPANGNQVPSSMPPFGSHIPQQRVAPPLSPASAASIQSPVGGPHRRADTLYTPPSAHQVVDGSVPVLTARRTASAVLHESSATIQSARVAGYPVGPFPALTAEVLKDTLTEVTMGTTGTSPVAGRFGLRTSKARLCSLKKGSVQEYCCVDAQRKKCDFRLFYELTFDGWVLYNMHPAHSHVLPQTQPEVMVTGAGRKIPMSYDELGNLLAEAGLAAKDIHRVFVVKSKREGLEDPTFKREDVYDKYIRVSATARALDARGLVEKLAARKLQTGLVYVVDQDHEGRIERIFVECSGAQEIWGTRRKRCFIEMVLMFDPTFGTNCYGMKLSMFVSVSVEGETKILAYVVHHEEDYADVFWAFTRFQEVFKHPPATLLTDSGAGILKAAQKMCLPHMPWHSVVHLLCVYHVDQNFYEHLHPLFAGQLDNWKIVHGFFWRMAKDSDLSECEKIYIRLAALKAFVMKHGSASKTKPKALKWIDEVLTVRVMMWAACMTWAFFSAGSHATVRSESTNGAVKTWLIKNSSLVALHMKLDDYVQFKEFKDSCQLQVRLLSQARVLEQCPLFVQEVKPYVSAYAFKLLLGQLSQVYAYAVTAMPDEDARSDKSRKDVPGTNYLVTRNSMVVAGNDTTIGVGLPELSTDGKTKSHDCCTDCGFSDSCASRWTTEDICSCQFGTSFGIPDRHVLAVRIYKMHTAPHARCTPFRDLFAERWITKHSVDLYASDHEDEDVPFEDGEGDPTACFLGLRKVMHDNLFDIKSVTPDGLNIAEHSGCYMAIKYGRPDQSGWHIALMTQTPTQDVMELFFCFSDMTRPNWLCDVRHMVKLPFRHFESQRMFSWLLLQSSKPGEQPASSVRNPRNTRGKGRPQTRRKVASGGGPLGR